MGCSIYSYENAGSAQLDNLSCSFCASNLKRGKKVIKA